MFFDGLNMSSLLLGLPGLDLDVGQFLDNLQLSNLKEIFEREQVKDWVDTYSSNI